LTKEMNDTKTLKPDKSLRGRLHGRL
jgi:hypothetical protein